MARPAWLLAICLCGAARALALPGASVLELDGLQWRVSNANGSVALDTTLPAYPLNLLQREGIIQDPLYRFGELETRWVALDTWTFEATFDAPPDVLERSNVDLVLNGVDTFASVELNGQQVASLENFHRRYLLPVKAWLRGSGNRLRITLHPAIKVAIERKRNHPYWIPTVTQLGNIDAYNFARKPAYDFGWDWGPGLGASGIYGGVSLAAYDVSLLRSAHVRQVRGPTGFILRIEPELAVPAGGDAGTLTAELPELGLKAVTRLEFAQAGRGSGTLELLVPPKSVRLWWPAGYGEQPLYDLTVSWTSSKAKDASNPTSSVARRVGFRTVELVEKPLSAAAAELLSAPPHGGVAPAGWRNTAAPGGGGRACAGMWDCGQYGWVDGKKWTFVSSAGALKPDLDHPVSGFDFAGAFPNSSFPGGDNPWWNHKLGVWTGWGAPALESRIEGESMFFKVNGVPIYAKGANIIPFHTLPVNATPELIATTVDMALDSKMNMLRVWGGGWYMPDLFYDIADEKGILVWQETMFACASYPRDSRFMAEVKAEVEQQIRRISWHPSVVIWGGNNEIETSLEWYRETQNNPALFVHDYTELFVTAIGGLMTELVPEIPYVDSSPSNGVVSRAPFIKRWGAAWDPRYGDVHHYDYNADCQDFKNYPMAKFVSEHGWPSFPTWATFKAATAPEDWAVGSPGMEFRQRHYNKTLEMTAQYMKHFKVPRTWSGRTAPESLAKWRRYLYLNHVQQALCIDTAFGYWRRLRSEPRGLTMGILYWQLNDVWAGASWSGIDYEGRYKPMQYVVKRQFSDFVVQAVLDGGYVQVFVVSDDTHATTAEIELSIYRLAPAPGAACAAACEGASCAAGAKKAAVAVAGAAAAGPPGGGDGADDEDDAAAAGEPVWRRRVAAPVPALNAALVVNASVSELLNAMPRCTPATCFLRVTAAAAATPAKPAQASAADLFFKRFRDLKLAPPKVSLSNFKQDGPAAVSFDVTTDAAAALLVVLEAEPRGVLSDNLLTLPPCGAARVTFSAPKGSAVTVAELRRGLAASSLWEHQTDDAPSVGAGDADGAGAGAAPAGGAGAGAAPDAAAPAAGDAGGGEEDAAAAAAAAVTAVKKGKGKRGASKGKVVEGAKGDLVLQATEEQAAPEAVEGDVDAATTAAAAKAAAEAAKKGGAAAGAAASEDPGTRAEAAAAGDAKAAAPKGAGGGAAAAAGGGGRGAAAGKAGDGDADGEGARGDARPDRQEAADPATPAPAAVVKRTDPSGKQVKVQW